MTDHTMRAMQLRAVGAPLELTHRRVPEPARGEVRVRIDACGVCGSDAFLQKGGFGPSIRLPVTPGHEAAGTIDALGDGVDGLNVGDQVAVYYISTPNGDAWAQMGRPNISPAIVRMGVDIDGAFAEYVLRPAASVIRPPRRVPPRALAVLTDSVATPLHALKRIARLRSGETLAIVGIGGLGSNAVQLGKVFGARVIAITRSKERQALARTLGADDIIPAADVDPVERVRALTGGLGADVVLQCAGSAMADEQAIAMGAPAGRVVLVGSSVDQFRVRAVDIFWRELSVLGSRGFVQDDIADAIDLYLGGRLHLDHLVEHARPLEEANEALQDLNEGRVLRSLLVPTL